MRNRHSRDLYVSPKNNVRLALIGGAGGFFGSIHRRSANLHHPTVNVIAGVLHENAEQSRKFGSEIGLEHPFGTLDELLAAAKNIRLDGVIIATPNNSHYPIARQVLEAGLAVFVEKPLVTELKHARHLGELGRQIACGQNFTYAGQAAWRKAAHIIGSGGIGRVLRIDSTYNQGWLWRKLNVWREKRDIGGPFGALFDIGSHCLYSALMFTENDPIARLRGGIRINVAGREVDDDGWISAVTKGGTSIHVHAIQVDQAGENDHRVRIVGESGTLELDQRNPELLQFCCAGHPHRTYLRGQDYSKDVLLGRFFPQNGEEDCDWRALPSAHPEGLHDAIGRNILCWADDVARRRDGQPLLKEPNYPTMASGVEIMELLFALEHTLRQQWIDCEQAADYPFVVEGAMIKSPLV